VLKLWPIDALIYASTEDSLEKTFHPGPSPPGDGPGPRQFGRAFATAPDFNPFQISCTHISIKLDTREPKTDSPSLYHTLLRFSERDGAPTVPKKQKLMANSRVFLFGPRPLAAPNRDSGRGRPSVARVNARKNYDLANRSMREGLSTLSPTPSPTPVSKPSTSPTPLDQAEIPEVFSHESRIFKGCLPRSHASTVQGSCLAPD